MPNSTKIVSKMNQYFSNKKKKIESAHIFITLLILLQIYMKTNTYLYKTDIGALKASSFLLRKYAFFFEKQLKTNINWIWLHWHDSRNRRISYSYRFYSVTKFQTHKKRRKTEKGTKEIVFFFLFSVRLLDDHQSLLTTIKTNNFLSSLANSYSEFVYLIFLYNSVILSSFRFYFSTD